MSASKQPQLRELFLDLIVLPRTAPIRIAPMPCRVSSVLLILFAALTSLSAQPPPPRPPHPPPGPETPARMKARIAEVQQKLGGATARTQEGQELEGFAKTYLREAEQALKEDNLFRAARLTDAADDCLRPLDHLRSIRENGEAPPMPPGPPDRMRQIYFRLRLCNYFLEEIPAPKPKRLLDLARGFYQDSLQATQAGEARKANEYGAAADDLTHALEHLAQAYAPAPPNPPPAPPGLHP